MVNTEYGAVKGRTVGNVESFKGIPYAAPPVGDNRWRAPQPPEPWPDTLDAIDFGCDCAQAPGDFEPLTTAPDENCLFLNIWRPVGTEASGALPVMVWIHGGGFVGGGSSIPYYDGSGFARQGIVLVSFNYRLGRLGFFAHPALLAAKEGPVGNFGLMDQIAALQWVQRNIASFGGDPGRVTIVGESAGGASVLTLLTSPAAKGLFHQAMIMSGGGREALLTRKMTGGNLLHKSADRVDEEFAEDMLGIEGRKPETLAALRALPPADLTGDLNLQTLLSEALLGNDDYPGTPMLDGTTAVARPADVFARGEASQIPVIIGTTAVDLPLIFPRPKIFPFRAFGRDADKARAAYQAPEKLDRETLIPILLSIAADMTMHEPARYVARQITASGHPAWLYRFTYTAESTWPESLATGQSHSGELPFLFDTLPAKYGDDTTEKDRQTARAFHTYVANFVKQSNPNGDGVPSWPAFDPAAYELLNFSQDGPVYGLDPRAERLRLVESVLDKQYA